MYLQHFNVTVGEDRTLNMTATDPDGNILTLTGATIDWRMGIVPGAQILLEKTGVVTSASAGTYSVTLTSTDTAPSNIKPLEYWYQSLITKAGLVTIGTTGRINFEGLINTSALVIG